MSEVNLSVPTEPLPSPTPQTEPVDEIMEEIHPCIRYRPLAYYEGKVIATPTCKIFPAIQIEHSFGTVKYEAPGQSPQDLMQMIARDYSNRLYVVSHPIPRDIDDTQSSMSGQERVLKYLAASEAPLLQRYDSRPITVDAPIESTYSIQGGSGIVYTHERPPMHSLSIHTAQFRNASQQQLVSSFLQELSMPSQVVSCDKFLDWTNYVSTWTEEERFRREAKTNVARFANLGYYKPDVDIEDDINQRIFVVQGDITAIECDV
ncbi:MAG: hypothetical protein EZS28_044114, partial [Streblomastix strix]